MPGLKNSIRVKSAANSMNVISDVSAVVRFLNFIGLCRYTANTQGVLHIQNSRLKCALLSFCYLLFSGYMVTLRFFWTYWEKSWDPHAYSELIETIMLQCLFLVVMFTAATESEVTILDFFSNLHDIDEILEINTDAHYIAERRYINTSFFSLVTAYLIKLLLEILFWMVSYGVKPTVPFFNNMLAGTLQAFSQFYYFALMSLFRLRLRVMMAKLQEQLSECSALKYDSTHNRFTKVLDEYKVCYALLYNQHNMINESHGLKLMLGIACILISIIRTIYSVPIYAGQEAHEYALAACIIRTVPDVLLLTALVVYVASISDVRGRTLHTLERLVCTQRLSEEEQTSVLRFIEQIQRQPLRFTAHNMFVLDYSLLCGLLHSTVTYIIILTEIKAPTSKY